MAAEHSILRIDWTSSVGLKENVLGSSSGQEVRSWKLGHAEVENLRVVRHDNNTGDFPVTSNQLTPRAAGIEGHTVHYSRAHHDVVINILSTLRARCFVRGRGRIKRSPPCPCIEAATSTRHLGTLIKRYSLSKIVYIFSWGLTLLIVHPYNVPPLRTVSVLQGEGPEAGPQPPHIRFDEGF